MIIMVNNVCYTYNLWKGKSTNEVSRKKIKRCIEIRKTQIHIQKIKEIRNGKLNINITNYMNACLLPFFVQLFRGM